MRTPGGSSKLCCGPFQLLQQSRIPGEQRWLPRLLCCAKRRSTEFQPASSYLWRKTLCKLLMPQKRFVTIMKVHPELHIKSLHGTLAMWLLLSSLGVVQQVLQKVVFTSRSVESTKAVLILLAGFRTRFLKVT